mgnify:FL=1
MREPTVNIYVLTFENLFDIIIITSLNYFPKHHQKLLDVGYQNKTLEKSLYIVQFDSHIESIYLDVFSINIVHVCVLVYV